MTANEMTDNEIIKEFEKEIKYVKENEKYDYFNPIVDIDLCEEVLNIMKLQNAIIEKSEKVEQFADKTIETANAEIERLNIELQSMRSAANSYKMHYEKAQTEIERLQKNIDGLNIFTKNHIKVIRLQAIKEFVEKFAKALSEFDMSSVGLPDYDRGYEDCMTAIEDTIDSLVKMTEEEE